MAADDANSSGPSENALSSLENALSCCNLPLVFRKEEGPKEAYYLPERAECGKCGLGYERSPGGHLYIQAGKSYDDMFCAKDGGVLERRLHLFKARGWPQNQAWEFVLYCPRHEICPEEFLDNILPKERFLEMMGAPSFEGEGDIFLMGIGALYAAFAKRKRP
jgi:hypothetical protein